MWDPTQYQRFGDERSRPFFELLDRIAVVDPRTVVDLGCGPGNLTATLADRWPNARVVGVDNDPAMLESAGNVGRRVAAVNVGGEPPGSADIGRGAAVNISAAGNLRFEAGDIASWTTDDPVDVLVSNAAYQWILGHLGQLPRLLDCVSPHGWFAFQVPANLDDPHHQAIREVRRRPHWASIPELAALPVRTHVSHPATTYVDAIAPLGWAVDAWQTSYVHILQGSDPILEWVKGTGLRPVLQALGDDERRDRFCAELAPLLREAYPSRAYGTPFPFRRTFVVAHRA